MRVVQALDALVELPAGTYEDTGWGLRASRAQPADPEQGTNTTGFRIVSDRGG
jgi:hypothetical protein